MQKAITNYRNRTNVTQESIAIDLGTNKANISNIQAGRRSGSMGLFENAMKNSNDPYFLNDLIFETTCGHTTPTPSYERVCDHRLSIKHRMQKELSELHVAMSDHRLDKRPEYLSDEEKEDVLLISSELLDVIYEMNALLMRFCEDYKFIDIQKLVRNRNRRYVIEKRIAR